MKQINLRLLLFVFVLIFVLGFSLSQTTAWKPAPKAANARRVLVVTGGHDRHANLNPNYQKLVRNAMQWAAGKLQ